MGEAPALPWQADRRLSRLPDYWSGQDSAAYMSGIYRRTLEAARPTHTESVYNTISGRVGRTRRLLCPLATDGRTIDMFVAGQVLQTEKAHGEAPTLIFAARFEPAGLFVIPP